MVEVIDRREEKARAKELLRSAQVSPMRFAALFLVLSYALNILDALAGGASADPLGLFVGILTSLLSTVLSAGFILYCMAIRQGQRAEYLTLFDGFSFAGRIVGLYVLEMLFILLWSMLFIVPGIIAVYRYQFAYFNLCENPELGCMDALELSKRQTAGYKGQLVLLDLSYLGWSLLATLPSIILTGSMTYSSVLSAMGQGYGASSGALMAASVLCALWGAAVQLFYLPAYQCVQLAYYETAKRTSGISPLSLPGAPEDGGFSL